MLQNAYLLAKIGADTAENEQNLPKCCQHFRSEEYYLANPHRGIRLTLEVQAELSVLSPEVDAVYLAAAQEAKPDLGRPLKEDV